MCRPARRRNELTLLVCLCFFVVAGNYGKKCPASILGKAPP